MVQICAGVLKMPVKRSGIVLLDHPVYTYMHLPDLPVTKEDKECTQHNYLYNFFRFRAGSNLVEINRSTCNWFVSIYRTDIIVAKAHQRANAIIT